MKLVLRFIGYANSAVRHADQTAGNVNALQKCHRLGEAEVSPRVLRVARLSSPETSNIAGLISLAGISGRAGVFLFL